MLRGRGRVMSYVPCGCCFDITVKTGDDTLCADCVSAVCDPADLTGCRVEPEFNMAGLDANGEPLDDCEPIDENDEP